MRIAFAGGGSAGHLFPALAVAQRFLRTAPEAEAFYFAARKPLDQELMDQYRLPHRLLSASGLPYGLSLRTLAGLARLARGSAEAYGALQRWRPSLIFGTGGYVTAAAVPAARLLGMPAVLHASDALPDRTSRRLAAQATLITVAFAAAADYFPSSKVIVTGQPVREEILQADRQASRTELGFTREDTVLLVTGGSQGARSLNNAVLNALPRLISGGLCLYHLTGQLDFERVQAATEPRTAGSRYLCRAYEPRMEMALAAADMILMRAGASSLAEAAAWGLPMILVPGAFAHGHQAHNAAPLAQRGAAIVIEDAALTGDWLAETALALRADEGRRQAMSAAARDWGSREAADTIVGHLLRIAGR